jgi:tryptophan synthase beta chain
VIACVGGGSNFGGHGHFDLSAYDAYLAGRLEDPEFSEADLEAALAALPEAPVLS